MSNSFGVNPINYFPTTALEMRTVSGSASTTFSSSLNKANQYFVYNNGAVPVYMTLNGQDVSVTAGTGSNLGVPCSPQAYFRLTVSASVQPKFTTLSGSTTVTLFKI